MSDRQFVGVTFLGVLVLALVAWVWALLGERDMVQADRDFVVADRDWWAKRAQMWMDREHSMFLQLCEERRTWVAELVRLAAKKAEPAAKERA